MSRPSSPSVCFTLCREKRSRRNQTPEEGDNLDRDTPNPSPSIGCGIPRNQSQSVPGRMEHGPATTTRLPFWVRFLVRTPEPLLCLVHLP